MIKRILSILLVLLMLCPIIAACAKNNDNSNDSSANTETQAPAATDGNGTAGGDETAEEVPKDYLSEYKTSGKTVSILYWSDYTMQEFFSEDDPANEIDQAIYRRNDAVKTRLGLNDFEFTPQEGDDGKMKEYTEKVKADFNANTVADFDIFASYSREAATLAIQGYTENLNALAPIDFSKPWWPASLVQECKIGDKVNFCSGDISTNLLWMMIGTFFNKELLKDYQIEYPYELVKSGDWTVDKLIEYTKDVYTDEDADGSKSKGDIFGYTIFNTNIDALGTNPMFTGVVRNDAGQLTLNPTFFGDIMTTYMSKLQNYFSTAEGVFRSSNATDARTPFRSGNCLFITDRLFIVAGKDNSTSSSETSALDFEYGVLPNPKYDASSKYYTNAGHPFTMYSISKKSGVKTEAAATVELMAAEGYRYVTPVVFETAMQLRYSKDEVDAEMFDMIRDNIYFETGRLFCDTMGTAVTTLFRQVVTANSFSVTPFNVQSNIIKTGIDKVNVAYGLNKVYSK